MQVLVRKVHTGYIARMLPWSLRVQELFAVALLSGSGGLTSMIVTQVLRPGIARMSKRWTASETMGHQQ